MSRRPLLRCLVAVLAAAIVLVWSPWRGGDPAERGAGQDPAGPDAAGAAETAERATVAAAAPPAASPEGAARIPLASEGADPGGGDAYHGWTGAVTLPDGSPAAGAEVRVEGYPFQRSVRTDDAGRYRLPWPAARRQYGDRHGPEVLLAGYASPPPTEVAPATPAAVVDFRLHAGLPVLVRVVEQGSGAPVPGATVRLFSWSPFQLHELARSGDDGWLTLHARGPGEFGVDTGTWSLANGSRLVNLHLVAGQPAPELQLEVLVHPELVRLHAVDAVSGEPLADASFWHRPRGAEEDGHGMPIALELPSQGGALDWRAPLAERPAVILVQAPEHRARVVFPVGPGDASREVRLAPAARTPVQVLVRGEEPTGDCRILWAQAIQPKPLPDEEDGIASVGSRPRPYWRGEVATDARGAGELPWPPSPPMSGTYVWLEVEAPGGLRVDLGHLDLGGLGEPPWILELQPDMAEVAIEAVGLDGSPLAGMEVRLFADRRAALPMRGALSRNDHEARRQGIRARGVTNEEGLLVLPLLAGGAFRWRAWSGALNLEGKDEEPLLPGERRPLLIAPAPPEQAIAGKILFADGSELDGSFTLVLRARPVNDSVWTGFFEVAADGSFHIGGIVAGEYEVLVLGGVGGGSGSFRARAGDEHVEFRLPPRQLLMVRAVDAETGAALEDFLLQIWSPNSTAVERVNGGLYRSEDFREVEGTMKVSATGYLSQAFELEAMTAEARADVVARLEPGRTLELRPMDADGAAVDCEWLEVLEPADHLDRIRRTMKDGLWRWRSAPRTALRLRFVDEDGAPRSEEFTIPAGREPVEMAVTLLQFEN